MKAETHRRWSLRTRFNLTPEEYEEILVFQGGGCALCGRGHGRYRLAVDHDHKTGLVRGILCWFCNAAVGAFKDDDEKMIRAAQYVQKPPATAALKRETYGQKGRVTNKRGKPKRKRRKT